MSLSFSYVDQAHVSETLSCTGKLWKLIDYDIRKAQYLMQTYELSALTAQILAKRLTNPEDAPLFLTPLLKHQLPDPEHLPDLQPALERIWQALRKGENIAIWGDYDVDGATSSALWVRYFRELEVEVEAYIPDRFEEGYGPNTKGLQTLFQKGIRLVITVDCGTTAFEPLAFAKAQGMDVIVIDHHRGEALNPACFALINPYRLDVEADLMEPYQGLAAVGLSFLVAVGLNRLLRQEAYFNKGQEPDLMSFLDLVALGTVCDVMSLKGLNRTFVAQGLKVLAKRTNLGLQTLCDVAGLNTYPTAYHLGFLLGPRINAGGRIGDASLGVRLLTCEIPREAEKISQKLNTLNQERQQIEAELEQEACSQALVQLEEGATALLVSGEGWHPGVIGIIAGRLKERFHRPTFMISFEGGQGKGSARSIPGLDISSLIHEACHQGLLLGGGGHAMAGGFSLENSKLEAFQTFLQHKTAVFYASNSGTPVIDIEACLTFQGLSFPMVEEIGKLAPFGAGNPQPRFLFQQVRISKAALFAEQHARLTLKQADGSGIEGVAFRSKDTPLGNAIFSNTQRPVDLVGTVQLSHWGGASKIQLIVEDVRTATM
ncbi:MAG: single-stranded-DNA-specific exonuclease RecJ [Alphaproteobacteria bacterium]